ncbi:hypothetical protein NGI13_00255 [Enterobacter asburiae]|uniref:hypothetical protein n=1 Tax=Enterobacter asburiae TaxID=61645 RepID=UPI002DB73418|nr:hypothetical protein [Enterobacter asburiae]MEB8254004.1 hypothetical protein [Enterobacter asburiae]
MKIILYLLSLLFVSPAFAGNYPVVIVTKITIADVGPPEIDAAYIKTLITDIGPGAEQIPPSGYVVTLFVRQDNMANDIDFAGHVYADGKRTIGEMAIEAYNASSSKYQNGSFTIRPSANNCVSWGAAPSTVSDWSTFIYPGGCMAFPPVNQTCKFVTPEVLLDHGSLGATDGNKVSEQISLQCTADMDVQFSFPDNGKYIYLGGQKAEITINSQALGSKISLPKGSSSVTIEDKLIGDFPEGVYTGSSVLIMTPY